jgi:tetratricopeptide (TPR) repeat protein
MPVSPVLATELEARGHGLLGNGRYGDAVPVLKRAVLATGKRLRACLEPTSSSCLTYAYALYDLGRALRLSGKPGAAVPILERRLEIDNQRPTVEAELQLAREGAV